MGNAAVRRVNYVVARARALKVHMALLAHIRKSLPLIALCGRRRRREQWLLRHIDQVYQDVSKFYDFCPSDLPDQRQFRQQLEQFPNFSRFPRWDDAKAADLDRFIDVDVPELLRCVSTTSASNFRATLHPPEETSNTQRRMPLIKLLGVAILVAALGIPVAITGLTSHPHTPLPTPSPTQVDRDSPDILTSCREVAFALVRPFVAPFFEPPAAPPTPAPQPKSLMEGNISGTIEKLRGWWASRRIL